MRIRVLTALCGAALLMCGAGLMVAADLGVGGFQVLETGVAAASGMPLGWAVALVAAGAALAGRLLGQRLTPVGLVVLVAIGPVVSAVAHAPLALAPPVLLAIGLALATTGLGALLGSGAGAMPHDLVFLGLRRPSRPDAVLLLGINAVVVTVGWLLGGQVGPGTLVVTLGFSLITPWPLRATERLLARLAPAAPDVAPLPAPVA